MKDIKVKEKKYSKWEAVQYLVQNNEYNDEWSGAGMYEIIAEVVEKLENTFFTKEILDKLLEKAKNN